MREFAAASRTQAIFAHGEVPSALMIFKDAVDGLLSGKLKAGKGHDPISNPSFPGHSDWSYESSMKEPELIPGDELAQLQGILSADPPLSSALYRCNAITLGRVRYQPIKKSRHNSPVLYKISDGTVHAGVIDTILREPDAPHRSGRFAVKLQRYSALDQKEALNDPYGNHPIVGLRGYDLIRLHHDSLSEADDCVFLENILSQLCVCSVGSMSGFDGPMVVTVAVDKV